MTTGSNLPRCYSSYGYTWFGSRPSAVISNKGTAFAKGTQHAGAALFVTEELLAGTTSVAETNREINDHLPSLSRRLSLHIISIVLGLIAQVLRAVLADGYLDALLCKAFAQRGAFDDTGELLSGVDCEGCREATSKNRAFSSRHDGVCALAGANIAHADF